METACCFETHAAADTDHFIYLALDGNQPGIGPIMGVDMVVTRWKAFKVGRIREALLERSVQQSARASVDTNQDLTRQPESIRTRKEPRRTVAWDFGVRRLLDL